MGLDNPDTLYFGTRVLPGHDYVVTGKRGTTTDVSFQLLGGEYTDEVVPDSETAFDDRKLDIAADGSFEWRFRPETPSQLVIREVYNDWSAQRGSFAIKRLDTAGTAPPPLTRELIEKRYATAGKQLVQRVKTWLQFPQWFYTNIPVNTLVAPRLTPGGLATQYSSVGHYELTPEQALVITLPVHRRAVSRLPAGQPVVHLAGLHQPPDVAERHSGASGSGRQDPHRGRRPQPWRDELGGDARASRRAILQFRWQRVSRELTEADGPTVELVDFDKIAAALPYYEQNKISEEDWRARIAERQLQIGHRMVG